MRHARIVAAVASVAARRAVADREAGGTRLRADRSEASRGPGHVHPARRSSSHAGRSASPLYAPGQCSRRPRHGDRAGWISTATCSRRPRTSTGTSTTCSARYPFTFGRAEAVPLGQQHDVPLREQQVAHAVQVRRHVAHDAHTRDVEDLRTRSASGVGRTPRLREDRLDGLDPRADVHDRVPGRLVPLPAAHQQASRRRCRSRTGRADAGAAGRARGLDVPGRAGRSSSHYHAASRRAGDRSPAGRGVGTDRRRRTRGVRVCGCRPRGQGGAPPVDGLDGHGVSPPGCARGRPHVPGPHEYHPTPAGPAPAARVRGARRRPPENPHRPGAAQSTSSSSHGAFRCAGTATPARRTWTGGSRSSVPVTGRRTRRRWDLNPRKGCPFTTLAGSRTRPWLCDRLQVQRLVPGADRAASVR